MTDAAQALQQLLDGNRRFMLGNATHPRQTAEDRGRVARDPHPFAAILACADSRVPPEVVFDQGLGDLFVVRVAGNVVNDAVLGSLEYAVERFAIPLIIVLGHQECAAVAATIDGARVGHVGHLVDSILPAVTQARMQSGDLLDNAVTANIHMGVRQVCAAGPLLSRMVAARQLRVIGARYALTSGAVDLLDDGA